MAVSKTRSAGEISEAVDAGIQHLGENYLQEALEKIDALKDRLEIVWHFIGPMQSNKTRPVAEHFDWVHSADRAKLLRRLSEQRPAELPPLSICLQLNISGEQSKSGCTPQELPALAALCVELPQLTLRGLMVIPAASDNLNEQRKVFAQARGYFESLQKDFATVDTLSMGMSGDCEAAVAEGSTMIRVGTGIFGSRRNS